MSTNYLRKFVDFAKKNRIWFEVATNGDLLSVEIFPLGEADKTSYPVEPTGRLPLGSEEAYQWLRNTYANAMADFVGAKL